MAYTPNDFGAVERLEASAVGPPGQRTFKLSISNGESVAALWLEKEQLQALGVAIDQLLARLSGRPTWKYYGTPPDPYSTTDDAEPSPSVEFKIGQLSLGYESDSKLFVLLAHDTEDDPEGPATLTCLASSAQLRSLGRRIEAVISAGRPRCTLCGDAIDGPHVCVRAN